MNFPEDLYYTEQHEWVQIDGSVGIVGITDYAQSELNDIVFVELKPVGTKVNQGDRIGTIEAVKAVSDLYAPVSGEIIEINTSLEKTPEIINSEPYNGGWMVKMKLTDINEVSKLLDVRKYRELIGK